jgi:hypothetical protein
MIINLIVNHQERYLKYALICIHSLITRGSVDPRNIHLVVWEKFKNEPAIPLLYGYGIEIEFRESIGGKFIEMDRLMKHLDIMLNLDVDTILTQDCDFTAICEEMISDGGYGCYLQPNNDPVRVQQGRFYKDLMNPRFLPDTEMGRIRLSNMIDGLFCISLDSYLYWLSHQRNWWFGGMILVNERMISYSLWRKMVAMNSIIVCDETVIAMSLSMTEVYFQPLDMELFPHVVNPLMGIRAYLADSRPGILHYAGDWYRETNQGNKITIEEIYQGLLK